MTKAQELFLQQAEAKKAKHPKTAPKIISFGLAMAFFGVSLVFIGIGHAPVSKGWVETMFMIWAIIALQGAVVCSSLGVTSCRYLLHCISSVTLALSLAIDVGFIIYYSVWVI